MPFFNNIITIMVTYLMISKNIAQKHMSTAKTDRMLENSATDTSIAVTATNIVAIRTTDYSSYRPLDVGEESRVSIEWNEIKKSRQQAYGGRRVNGLCFENNCSRKGARVNPLPISLTFTIFFFYNNYCLKPTDNNN